ncbi:nuclear transport factor 2 family protein [Bacteroidota bacterium]
MKKTLYTLFLIIFIVSCTPQKEELTIEEIEKEKQAIIQVMKDYNVAAESKNFSHMIETLAGEVIFFGTDSSEVIKTFADYKKKMIAQWEAFDKMKYGEMYDVSIQMDDNATLASIIFGTPLDITIGDETANLFIRIARTLKKEKGKWVIVSGIVGHVDPAQAFVLDDMIKRKLSGGEQEETPQE